MVLPTMDKSPQIYELVNLFLPLRFSSKMNLSYAKLMVKDSCKYLLGEDLIPIAN